MKETRNPKFADTRWILPCLFGLALAGCGSSTGEDDGDAPSGTSGSSGIGGAGPLGGNAPLAGAGGNAPLAGAAGNAPTAGSGGSSGTGTGTAGAVVTGGGGAVTPSTCAGPMVPRAPTRRLTRFEYNNTVRDLKLDSTNQAFNLPSEELGNGYGNDADTQSAAPELIDKYQSIAEAIAAQVTTPALLPTTVPCAAQVTAATEATCARSFVDTFLPKAFRRPVEASEAQLFMGLFTTIRMTSTFASSIAAIIEAVLQDPAFLYRLEFGAPVEGRPNVLRPTGYEMATRLSYLFWGTTPDDALRGVAGTGALDTPQGVRAQAATMLADQRSRAQVKFFFNNLLPIASLSQLEREEFPAYTAKLGALMRQETETFLEHHIFSGPGTWPSAFTADYTFVNQQLATFYGIAGVTGEEFRKVPVDPLKRLGLLSQAGVAAGVIHSNETNPVTRGGFIVNKLLCQQIPLPTGDIAAMVSNPAKDPNRTTRERYAEHSKNVLCAGCHLNMDPIGFALENFDPIGQWRDKEGTLTIDASGNAPALGAFNGPAELGKRMSENDVAQACFAQHWANYGYGRTLKVSETADSCVLEAVQTKFKASGYNVQQLLLALTENDTFLYMPAARE